MRHDSSQAAVRDRCGDPAPAAHLVGKRPVLGRGTLRGLCAVCLLVIVYGTVGPLGLNGGPWLVQREAWSWVPPWRPTDFNDLFTNFVVYVPVGFAFRLLVRRRGLVGAPDFVVGLFLSLALSYATEVAQQFMPARSANLRDFVVNAAAALVGGLIAPHVQRWLRQTHVRAFETREVNSWRVLAWTSAVVTGGLMVVPLYPAPLHFELDLTRSLDLQDVRRFGMFVMVGFCITAAAIQERGNTPAAVRAALRPILAIAVIFELAQLYIATHTCGLLDMFVAALGGVTGCAGATKAAELGIIGDGRRPPAARGHGAHQHLQAVALVATALCVLAFGLRRLTIPSQPLSGELVVFWTPFQAHFSQPFHRAVAELFESFSLYAFLTMMGLLLRGDRGRALALLVVLSLATLVESLRLLLGRGAADVTPIVVAALAWVATTRFWNALTPQMDRFRRATVASTLTQAS